MCTENKFQPFVTRFQHRTGLTLCEIERKRIRDNYREYEVQSTYGLTLFKIGVSLDCKTEQPYIGMCSQPDMYHLDPQSSASYRRSRHVTF